MLMSACTLVPTPLYRFYLGDARPSSEVALIKTAPSTYISHVDGVALPAPYYHPCMTARSCASLMFDMEILPGLYTVTVDFDSAAWAAGGPVIRSTGPVDATFVAEPGHVYTVSAYIVPGRNQWHPLIKDKTAGKRVYPEKM
jgi:hypothetical protein